ncbi:hypothetical protein SD427_14550 [Chryseobacterium sp. JJR-5R]|uniref:hypothetical protein n=1 Tax=Chryseobacterium sp. JJR-5R TaxID=3093923 RepID=UPI002A75EC6A|nr:hypothetical protein [Chryseobacterium sp. JJR-5R]WPO81977.1 hypothetical protein SD427_14550 [Chryseobacterium sp. JJR-5R]
MKKIKFDLLLISMLLYSVLIFSQSGFIPPSPQSFSFIKATNAVSENEHIGSANVNIPLFNYKANKLSTGISILYNGAGVKVDDLPNESGMTWVLNTGGVVTRTVNGLIDELATMRMNKSEAELIQKTASDCAADEEIRSACYTPFQMDTERDLFEFRFADISGSFYLDQNFLPVFLKNDDDIKIKNILPNGETNNRKFTGFEITTNDGVKYIFGGSIDFWETTASKAMPANPPGDYAVTSFFLKEIQSLTGEKINFSYEETLLTVNKISEIHSLYLCTSVMNGGNIPNIEPTLRLNTQTHYTRNKKRIKTISNSENGDIINFIYSDKTDSDFKKYLSEIEYRVHNVLFKKILFNYLFEDPEIKQTLERFYLSQIKFYVNDIFEKKYQFSYNDPLSLPSRLSYSQDMFGYFNGRGNPSLIAGFFNTPMPPSASYNQYTLSILGDRRPDFSYASKGILTEVIYPTGGKTKFEYESPKSRALFHTNVSMPDEFFPLPLQGGTTTKIIENLQSDQLISYILKTYSGPQSQNHMNIASFEIRDLDSNQLIHSDYKYYGYAPSDSITGHFSLYKDKRYIISFKPWGSANLTFSYSHKDPVDDFGLRLKAVTHSENGQNSEYKRFYYRPIQLYNAKEEDLNAIDFMTFPTTQDVAFKETHDGLSGPVFYSLHSSNNSSELYNNKLRNRYRFVTCSVGGDHFEAGGYQKSFKTDSDDPLIRIQPASAPGNSAGPPSSGMGFTDLQGGLKNMFGTMLNNMYFSAKGNRLSFSGTLNQIRYFRKKGNSIVKIKEERLQNKYNIISTNPNLFISQTFDDITNGVCGSTSVQRIANFYISVYKNYTVDTKLQRKRITEYIDEVPVSFYNNYGDYLAADSLNTSEDNYRKLISTINYEYSGMPAHSQVTREIAKRPEGAIIETTYQYAVEKNNQKLVSANMTGIPLETLVIERQDLNDPGKTTSRVETVYPDQNSYPTSQAGSLLLPLSAKSSDQLTGVMSTEVSYDKYDEKGNVLQYTGKDGIPVTIIWGYNKTQPIAKVEGMTYDQLNSLASPTAIIGASNEDGADPNKEGLLLDALSSFRKNSQLADKKVTTYTYDPLIGVTSITPPSGIRQVFTYDAANRLKETKVRSKDNAGAYTDKKAAEYKYNYKP